MKPQERVQATGSLCAQAPHKLQCTLELIAKRKHADARTKVETKSSTATWTPSPMQCAVWNTGTSWHVTTSVQFRCPPLRSQSCTWVHFTGPFYSPIQIKFILLKLTWTMTIIHVLLWAGQKGLTSGTDNPMHGRIQSMSNTERSVAAAAERQRLQRRSWPYNHKMVTSAAANVCRVLNRIWLNTGSRNTSTDALRTERRLWTNWWIALVGPLECADTISSSYNIEILRDTAFNSTLRTHNRWKWPHIVSTKSRGCDTTHPSPVVSRNTRTRNAFRQYYYDYMHDSLIVIMYCGVGR